MTNTAHIFVNGTSRPWVASRSLSELIAELKLNTPHMAIAVNDRIVPRQSHAATLVQPGDRIEIVQAVGGG